MAKISRALISVSDKTGVVKFSEALNKMGVEIISTGGTAKKLKESGDEVIVLSQTEQKKLKELSDKILQEKAAKDPFFAKVLKSQRDFAKAWDEYAEISIPKY